MGSSLTEIERTVAEWSGRLLGCADDFLFRSWLMKEYPAHMVSVESFAMMRTPVTNGEYRAFLRASTGRVPQSLRRGMPHDHPVWGVEHAEARAFARWRSEIDGLDWRLPTEAEWEWAASGAEGRRYPFGDSFCPSACNTVEAGLAATVPVGSFANGISPWGVLDLAGNVEEWTDSSYSPYPGGKVIEDDLLALRGPGYPILRGGSFALGGDLARCRRRHGRYIGPAFEVTGFRLAQSLPR